MGTRSRKRSSVQLATARAEAEKQLLEERKTLEESIRETYARIAQNDPTFPDRAEALVRNAAVDAVIDELCEHGLIHRAEHNVRRLRKLRDSLLAEDLKHSPET